MDSFVTANSTPKLKMRERNYPVSERKAKMEETIAKFREETMKDLDDIDRDFEAETTPWLCTFSVLEAMNTSDERSQKEFMEAYDHNKAKIARGRRGVMQALDLMEKDFRKSHKEFEAKVMEKGEPSSGQTVIYSSMSLGDYYKGEDLD